VEENVGHGTISMAAGEENKGRNHGNNHRNNGIMKIKAVGGKKARPGFSTNVEPEDT